jgi:phosphoglucomutase/phosphopentomutase
MDPSLQVEVDRWLAWDRNESTRAEVQKYVDAQNIEELRARLTKRMEFGTAGLRASMGTGNAHMNDLTILQTTQGLLRYLESQYSSSDLQARGVAVSYDARRNSERFASIVASIFAHAGVRVYKFTCVTPTPFVPFTVLRKGCVCGIMVTASHNPKDDNGYKVYWANGAQIIPPHDVGIAEAIERCLEPWSTSWDISTVDGSRVIDPFDDVSPAYFAQLKRLCRYSGISSSTPIRVAYTAMHGVGARYVVKAFEQFGLPAYIPVAAQVEPDGTFPTVVFPNPEEGKSALELAMRTAESNQCSIIIANDPDADRLAVAERQPAGGWKVFTGNELGALLGWWAWSARDTAPNKKYAMLHSTVSSTFLHSMGAVEGFLVEETLTGFKWMGNRCEQLQAQGYDVLFCFEEAIGFMCGTAVRDKDGVSAAAVCYEMCAVLQSVHGRTLTQQLAVLYSTYGVHLTRSSYYSCADPKVTKRMFEEIRDYKGSGSYPKELAGCTVTAVRDLTTGYDSSTPDNKPLLPTSASSQMITLSLKLAGSEGRVVITIRGSGTEPKIKYYAELTAPGMGVATTAMSRDFDDLIEVIVQELYQPTKLSLTPRKL